MVNMKSRRQYEGITYIYGLIDPRNQQLRYVGKTVLQPSRRLSTHRWQARNAKHKRHVHAWIIALANEKIIPEVIEIEAVKPFGDWEEAEKFWIEYFRFIGSDLCNLTSGGEGAPGAVVSDERRAKLRERCGPRSPLYKIPKEPHVHAALREGNERLQADPVRRSAAERNRRAGFTPEVVAGMAARFAAYRSDPVKSAYCQARRTESLNKPEHKAKVGAQSSHRWATMRNEIIAAQNAGKGDEFKRKQSVARKKLWADKECPYWKVFLTPEKREQIRECLRQGMKGVEAAKKFGLSQSRVSQIKLGS